MDTNLFEYAYVVPREWVEKAEADMRTAERETIDIMRQTCFVLRRSLALNK